MKKLIPFFFFLSQCCTSQLLPKQIVTDHDINEIYRTHIAPNKTQEYAQRYVPLPLKKNTFNGWKWEGKDFPRVIAILEFERFVSANKLSSQKGLAINGIDPEWHYIPSNQIIKIDYEKDPKNYDLHTLNLPDKDFDFVMVNQTLEHLYDPIGCLENLYKHMRVGGILYLNAPADSILHSTPYHYYTGFTPTGLGVILKAAGFTILSIGQWGNAEYLTKMHVLHIWPTYQELTNPGLNDVDTPVIVWAFATKGNL
jgi:SAM-dependent methyltransferase